MARVRVVWTRSTINRPEPHKRTIRALGFKHLNQSVEHELTPQIEGMLRQVCHLVRVEEIAK
jgi:large subunit ribosomal protein L30